MSEAGPPPDNIEPAPAPAAPAPQVGFMRVLRYFARLGTTGFGGPIATVGYMQRDLVEHRGWIDRRDFLDGVALGQTIIHRGPTARCSRFPGFSPSATNRSRRRRFE